VNVVEKIDKRSNKVKKNFTYISSLYKYLEKAKTIRDIKTEADANAL
jgi:hypothetical protein